MLQCYNATIYIYTWSISGARYQAVRCSQICQGAIKRNFKSKWDKPFSRTAASLSEKLVKKSVEFEALYKKDGYQGDIIPASWDDYIISEDAENADEINDGINDDIEEEDGDDGDGFATMSSTLGLTPDQHTTV